MISTGNMSSQILQRRFPGQLSWLPRFFSPISNTCGGYSFYKDAKLLRLTRYRYNNVPADSNGRYFYLKEGNSIWNPGWQPTQTPLDFYECRHGMVYSRFTGQKNHLKASLLTFVPLEDSCEDQSAYCLPMILSGRKRFSCFLIWNGVSGMRMMI